MLKNELDHKKSRDTSNVTSFGDLLKKHIPEKRQKKSADSPQQLKKKDSESTLLKILFLFPWLLGFVFIFSFFWDFHDVAFQLWGYTVSFEGILRFTSVSGLIGFFTNWIAIQMLFYPRKKRPVLGHGLIPSQKDRIARRLADAVEQDLINVAHIKRKLENDGLLNRYSRFLINYTNRMIADKAFQDDFRDLFNHYIRTSLEDPEIRNAIRDRAATLITKSVDESRLEKTAVRLYLMLRGKNMNTLIEETLDKLPEKISLAIDPVDDILSGLPKLLYKEQERIEQTFVGLTERVLDNIPLRKIVEDNLNSYDELRLGKMIQNATNAQLNYIKYLGAIIGTGGGLIIWNPLTLAILIPIAFFIWFLDGVLMKYSNN